MEVLGFLIRLARSDESRRTYHLLKRGDGWRIDGIKCAEGGSFNMR
jgi:hypothetical protein